MLQKIMNKRKSKGDIAGAVNVGPVLSCSVNLP